MWLILKPGSGDFFVDEMLDNEIETFLKNEVTCRLGLSVDDTPYIVPLSYVYMDGFVYIHLVGGRGKKAEWIERNPNVCVEVDTYSKDHLYRKSVIIQGKAEKVTDRKTLVEFLAQLAAKYPHFAPGGIGKHPQFVKPFLKLSLPLMASKVTVYRIKPVSITGRKSEDRR